MIVETRIQLYKYKHVLKDTKAARKISSVFGKEALFNFGLQNFKTL